ncbi:unnamed protein product [Eruca vesicaria subsp. sativa]|uniref:Uncharacterized protein n=1 Tax=Eruca vesicaria subsp. sativa TaxID=29727 RepID=A0ABC8JKS5_ERUVS|nr:unnamed protein product [Eruca vesicaria subsp. sativa]
MSLDMLFIDENVSTSFLINAVDAGSVNVNRQFMFSQRLSKGSVYKLSGFVVTRSIPNFQMLDAPFSIWFNNGTFS